MRQRHEPSSDAQRTVIDAVRVAIEPQAAALGPVAVMSSEIHLARWVREIATHGLHALRSPGFGPVGAIVEDRPRIWARSTSVDFIGLPDRLTAHVEIVGMYLGADDRALLHAAEIAEGVVVAALGGGHVPPSVAPAVQRIVQSGIPVVIASRTLGGPILEGTYSGPGSETDLLQSGAVSAGLLPPAKARIRLAIALALGLTAHDVFPA
jgi:L-asparaginase